MNSSILLGRAGPVATLTLNRPEAGNAIDVAMADAFLAAVLECDADSGIRCVVLTGAGEMFCTGGDVRTFAAAGDQVPALIKRLTAPLHAGIARLTRMEKPLITSINGAAAGAGFGLAILGDVALAGRSAKFATAYGALGLSPDAGTTWLLPRLVGLRQAQRLSIEGQRIDAPEAERIGLISRVVEDDALADETRRLADRLAAASMGAVRRTRELLHASFRTGLETHLETEAQGIAQSSATAEGREGIRAFINKRKPNFRSAQ